MATNDKNGIKIVNIKLVLKAFEQIDITNPKNRKMVRVAVRKPFVKMKDKSKANLRSQGSYVTGNLYRGLGVGSSFKRSKGRFSVAFGAKPKARLRKDRIKIKRMNVGRSFKRSNIAGKINHFHLINSGTIKRKTRKGYNRGAVGKAKTHWDTRNYSFQLGFADKAIRSVIPTIPDQLSKDLTKIYGKIIRNLNT